MTLPQGTNPYTLLKHELLHQRPYVRFYRDQVRVKEMEKDYSYIEVDDSAGIVVLNDKGEVALVGQWRYPVKQYRWEVPAGMAEPGESPLENAKRELKEETGVVAQKWTELGSFQMDGSKMDQHNHLFLAEDLSLGENTPMDDEELEMLWVPLEQAISLVETGEIRDGLTVIGLFRVQEHLRKRGQALP